jgi:hypothetical protein
MRLYRFFSQKEENLKGGRPGKRYMISLNQFEDLLMAADTKAGRDTRKMFRQLKDAVQNYMKIEIVNSNMKPKGPRKRPLNTSVAPGRKSPVSLPRNRKCPGTFHPDATDSPARYALDASRGKFDASATQPA